MADTRRQILLTIKEQAQLLKEPVSALDPSRQHRWSPQQWWESFTFLVRNHVEQLPRIRMPSSNCDKVQTPKQRHAIKVHLTTVHAAFMPAVCQPHFSRASAG